MAKKAEIRYGTCQNPECMNLGMSMPIPEDGLCPMCHKPMKPESDDLDMGTDFDNLGDDNGMDIGGGRTKTSFWEKNGKLIGIIAAVMAVLGGGGFGIYKALSGGTDYSKVKLSLDQKELVLQPGERKQLTPAVEPADAKATYTWKSTDETVATVKSGVVTAVKEGEATIVVSIEEDNTKKVRCNVQVAVPEDTLGPKPPVLIENMNFTQPKLALSVGESATLNLVVSPEQNDEGLTIASSDEKVVVVDGATVKGVKAGTATVTVTSSISAKQASVEVTVKGREPGRDDGNTPGTVNLGYGTYEGPRKNYKADGFGGEIRFTRNYSIDLKKASGETVEVGPGDVMVNVKMKDNRVIQGVLKRADGSQRQIIIG